MIDIEEIIQFLKEVRSQPKKASYDNEIYSFELTCMFSEGSLESKIINTFNLMGIEKLPLEYNKFLCTRQKNHPHPIFIGLGVKKLTNCRNTVLSLLKNTK